MSFFATQTTPAGTIFCISSTCPGVPAPRLPLWYLANIIPIPKAGKTPDITSSYRPISLTSCIAKCLERMIQCRFSFWLESRSIFHPDQAGFRKGRGTEEQVASLIQFIHDGLQRRDRTVAVMVDFSRAYDRVWKEGLLAKLGRIGTPTCLTRWIRSFLADRRAFVSWGPLRSRVRIMKEGLPQAAS